MSDPGWPHSNRYWTLDGRTAVPGASLAEWGRMMDDFEKSWVGSTEVAGWGVSTVFLGYNHRFLGGGPPLLFETMIFDYREPRRDADESCWRYSTWEAAEAGHNAIVEWLRRDPDGTGEPPDLEPI